MKTLDRSGSIRRRRLWQVLSPLAVLLACSAGDPGQPVPRGRVPEPAEATGALVQASHLGLAPGRLGAAPDVRGGRTFAFSASGSTRLPGVEIPPPAGGGRHLVIAQTSKDDELAFSQVLAATLAGANGVPEVELRAFAADPLGRILVAGTHTGGMDAGGGELPAGPFIAGFSPDGFHRWSLALSTLQNPCEVHAFAFSDGHIHAIGPQLDGTGNTLLRFEPSGELVLERELELSGTMRVRAASVANEGGGFVVVGSTGGIVDLGGGPIGAAGVDNPLIVRLGFDGSFRRTLWFPEAQGEISSAARAAAGVVFGGTISGTIGAGDEALTTRGQDGLLLALNDASDIVWRQLTGHSVVSVTADAAGRVRAAGAYEAGDALGAEVLEGDASPDRNLYVAAFEVDDGALLWANAYSSNGRIDAEAATVNDAGDFALLGHVEGTSSLFGVPAPAGMAFVLRLAP